MIVNGMEDIHFFLFEKYYNTSHDNVTAIIMSYWFSYPYPVTVQTDHLASHTGTIDYHLHIEDYIKFILWHTLESPYDIIFSKKSAGNTI